MMDLQELMLRQALQQGDAIAPVGAVAGQGQAAALAHRAVTGHLDQPRTNTLDGRGVRLTDDHDLGQPQVFPARGPVLDAGPTADWPYWPTTKPPAGWDGEMSGAPWSWSA